MKQLGRPKIDVSDRLSEMVAVRLTKYERAKWEEAANSSGMSLSEWIRDCVFVANLDQTEETDE